MNKKEFVFPGVVLGLVLIIAIGLLVTHENNTPQINTAGMATSTNISSTTPVSADSEVVSKPSKGQEVTPTPTHYYPYGSITLSLNQVAGFKNGSSIRTIAVLEDSRCPKDVMCIQAGTVKVSLKVTAKGITNTHTVSLGQTVAVGGMHVTLVTVDPLRTKDGSISQKSYKFTYKVELAS